MDYVQPSQVAVSMVEAGTTKADTDVVRTVVRSVLAGAILACATTLAFTASDQTGVGLAGTLVFPVGFVLIVLLGLELVTGSFALVPLAVLEKRCTVRRMFAVFGWAIAGHLIGCLVYAGLYALAATKMGTDFGGSVVRMIVRASEAKTIAYKNMGVDGLLLVFIKAVLCNWLVTLGAVVAMVSSSAIGKIAAMWLPIMMFFGQGFEHAVVNLFVIPAGMMLGAKVGLFDWWIWNQIPVFLGNFIGGALGTGLLFYAAQKRLNWFDRFATSVSGRAEERKREARVL